MQSHRTGETPHGTRIRTDEERARAEFQQQVDKYGGTPPGDAVRTAMGQDIPDRNPMFTPEQTAEMANQIFPVAMGNTGSGVTLSSPASSQVVTRARAPGAPGAPAEASTRVGRWMSSDEAGAMQGSGTVQESRSGLTHVANPADASVFRRQAPSGSVYVEFNVPTSSLRPSGTGVSSIPGPNAPIRPAPSMPSATDIIILETKP